MGPEARKPGGPQSLPPTPGGCLGPGTTDLLQNPTRGHAWKMSKVKLK